MSHIVQIQTQVRDAEAVQAACRRLGLPAAVQGSTKLFSGTVTGLAVKLPGWNYPVVCDLSTGQLHYDNYSQAWGHAPPAPDPKQTVRLQRRRAELAKRRTALRRWLTRLKRATNTVTDLHQRIARLEAALSAD